MVIDIKKAAAAIERLLIREIESATINLINTGEVEYQNEVLYKEQFFEFEKNRVQKVLSNYSQIVTGYYDRSFLIREECKKIYFRNVPDIFSPYKYNVSEIQRKAYSLPEFIDIVEAISHIKYLDHINKVALSGKDPKHLEADNIIDKPNDTTWKNLFSTKSNADVVKTCLQTMNYIKDKRWNKTLIEIGTMIFVLQEKGIITEEHVINISSAVWKEFKPKGTFKSLVKTLSGSAKNKEQKYKNHIQKFNKLFSKLNQNSDKS